MRLRSDTLCWLRRASRDGSCRLVIQNGAGAPEAAAGQGNPHRFFHLAYPAITLSIFATCHAKPARLSITSFRRATVAATLQACRERRRLVTSQALRACFAKEIYPGRRNVPIHTAVLSFRHQQELRASVRDDRLRESHSGRRVLRTPAPRISLRD